MRKIMFAFIVNVVLLPGFLGAQPPQPMQPPQMIQPVQPPPRAHLAPEAQPVQPPTEPAAAHPPLPRFDLNFGGGTPGMLVSAIEKASGHPLNTIIPPEYAQEVMPPLRMKSVNVAELFKALEVASQNLVAYSTGTYNRGPGSASRSYQQTLIESGFECSGEVREDSIWVFYKHAPPVPPDTEAAPEKICRFFQLGPYLERYKVEDITTAVESGWRMLGDTGSSQLSFHKDTKLLIAVGPPDKLQLIDSVLEQLRISGPPVMLPPETAPPARNGQPDK